MEFRTTMGAMTGNTSADLKTLYNYIFQLTEEMRYLMANLDVTNFNDLGLARYEQGRLQVYSEVVEVRASKVESIVEALGDDLGEFENWTETEISDIRSSITQTATEINLNVQTLDTELGKVQSDLKLTSNSLSAIVSSVGSGGSVTAASIIAAINNDTSSVKIKADKITLEGDVTATALFSVGSGSDDYNTIEIVDGFISLYAGEITSWSSSLNIEGYDELRLASNSGVSISPGNGLVEIGTGSGFTWRFTEGTIDFCGPFGEVIGSISYQ